MAKCNCNRRPDEPCCGKHYQNFGDSDERDEFTDQDVQARDEEAERIAKREVPERPEPIVIKVYHG